MNKTKIAILLSGNINEKINAQKIKAGYNLKYCIKILRHQFEKHYDVDYFCVFNEKFKQIFFNDKLKGHKIIDDSYIQKCFKIDKKKNKKKGLDYQFKRRYFLSKFVNKYKDYYKFYIYKRNDTILVPNGYGLWDRNVPYEKSTGWKKANYIDEKYFKKDFKFKDNFDLNYLYYIPYYNNIITNIMWDGFALGDYKTINHFLNYKHDNGFVLKPERELFDFLIKNKVKLKDINDILDIPITDSKLQMITDLRFVIDNYLEKMKKENKLHLLN